MVLRRRLDREHRRPSEGWQAEATLGSFAEAVEWLRAETVRCYPGSEFARKWGRGFV
jgi:hypothetical protein